MLDAYVYNIAGKSTAAEIYFISLAALWTTGLIILVSVVYKFVEYSEQNKKVAVRRRHVVETFSMAIVILSILAILQKNAGVYKSDYTTGVFSLAFGFIIAVLSTGLHLWAKMELGRFWSNQIEIVDGHKIMTTGPYMIVRHPMYSSLIFWLLGLSIMFMNPAAIVITLGAFVPMMYLRAKAEEELLAEADNAGMKIYALGAGMLLPRFGEKISLLLKLASIVILGYSILKQQMNVDRVVLLSAIMLLTGFLVISDKVRFAYRNKSIFLLLIFIATTYYPGAYFLYYVILFTNIWGLKYNCPCMYVHERYKGCPCFKALKDLVVKS